MALVAHLSLQMMLIEALKLYLTSHDHTGSRSFNLSQYDRVVDAPQNNNTSIDISNENHGRVRCGTTDGEIQVFRVSMHPSFSKATAENKANFHKLFTGYCTVKQGKHFDNSLPLCGKVEFHFINFEQAQSAVCTIIGKSNQDQEFDILLMFLFTVILFCDMCGSCATVVP